MPDLRNFLQARFRDASGAMPFDQFMAMALYDPNFGYYMQSIEDVGGRSGDFATSATLSKGLARAVSRWILEERERFAWDSPVSIIEVGGGNGALAEEIWRSLGWWKRRQFHYHLVDVSPVLREKQRARLRGDAFSWHENVSDALEASSGRALVFSNELFDAFPAKWLRWSEAEATWMEVFVKFDTASGLRELMQPLPRLFPSDAFSAMESCRFACGQRIEIQPLAQSWLANVSDRLEQGAMLTIDYGGEPQEIYARRPEGTLRGYFRQERVEGAGIYQRFGKQDLTVDVNFCDLRNWGSECGLETVFEESQGEFLARYGEGGDIMAGDGVGQAFRVLSQRRD